MTQQNIINHLKRSMQINKKHGIEWGGRRQYEYEGR